MIVIASIHQPSTNTLMLFDNVLLLSEGKSMYFGPPDKSTQYFTGLGYPPHQFISPAEAMLDLVNVDFVREDRDANILDILGQAWQNSGERKSLMDHIEHGEANKEIYGMAQKVTKIYARSIFAQTWIQLHRMLLKAYRDFLAYGVRIAMYLGLAILMGTAWLRLSYVQENIQNFLTALFFGSAFMSFMVRGLLDTSNLQGRRVYPGISRRSCSNDQRTRQWSLRPSFVPISQHNCWNPFPLYNST
jgi:ABC-2 type transporter